MPDIAKKYSDKLPELKKKVEDFREYFSENIKRYHQFIKFVFKTAMDEDEIQVLQELGKPNIEFNIIEAYLSRLLGEFSKHQPSISVDAADCTPDGFLTPEMTQTLKLLEGHFRAIFFDVNNDNYQYKTFKDMASGGYSVTKVGTKYVNEMSFDQNIYIKKCFDNTMCVFDPMARDSHKGDGEYTAEVYPITREHAERLIGKDKVDQMKFTRNLEGFSWSYKNGEEDVIMVCDMYHKEYKERTIIKLANDEVIFKEDYEKYVSEWESSGKLEVVPAIVGEPRNTTITMIRRYLFCESCIIETNLTDYRYLPHVFSSGSSVMVTEGNTTSEVTRPYLYQAVGIQKLKNFAGQSLASELENTVQHKILASVQSIPTDYQEAYQNVQKADVLLFNEFLDGNPEVRLSPPREIVRTPIPPQIEGAFRMSDEMTQVILGSYDNTANNQKTPWSGKAVMLRSMNSNGAASPFLDGYIAGLNRIAEIIIDLIPKYYKGKRTIPVMSLSGKREYKTINNVGGYSLDYDPTHLQVRVEAGVNFALQKEMAMETLTALMQTLPRLAEFIQNEGSGILLDNIDIRGIEELKQKFEEWEKKNVQQNQRQQAQQTQQAQEIQAMQIEHMKLEIQEMQKQLQSPTKEQVDMAKLQHHVQKDMADMQHRDQVDSANIQIKEQLAEATTLATISKISAQDTENELKAAQIQAEEARTQVDAVESMLSVSKHIHEMQESNNGERQE